MKAILIGAGRGQRLMPLTGEAPKCYAEIGGRRILDCCLVALASAGLRDVVFVGGYLIERLEFTIPVAGDFAVLRELPDDRLVGLGCVDCRAAAIDSAETIVGRVEQALGHVDRERVSLNPDCGFAPGSAADIPIDEAYAKLRNEAAAARILRERHAR